MPEYLTTQEVADLCRTSPKTVPTMSAPRIGRRPTSIKPGRRVLYAAADVRSWLDSQQRQPAAS